MPLHGGESWVLTSDLCCQLDSFQTSFLRIILGVSRTDHVSHKKSVIELEQSPFPNQLKPDRSDSWAIVFSALRRTLFLIALTHGKPRPGGHKILFNEYATKLINPENPPFLTKFIL